MRMFAGAAAGQQRVSRGAERGAGAANACSATASSAASAGRNCIRTLHCADPERAAGLPTNCDAGAAISAVRPTRAESAVTAGDAARRATFAGSASDSEAG